MHAARSVRVAQLSALLARLFARSTRLLDKMPTPEEISELKEINEFLEEHGVEEAIALAVGQVIKQRPPDPVTAKVTAKQRPVR